MAGALILFGALLLPAHAQLGLPPSITVHPSNQTVLVGGTATFQVVASSLTTMSYKWYRNGDLISGATSSTYSLTNVQATNAGTFYVEVRNLVGPTLSSNATLTVLVPPTITTQPLSQTATQGLAASFSAGASGTAPLGYQWRYSGTNLPGATNATLVLNNLQFVQAGNYSVTVSNVAGTAVSSNAILTVTGPPVNISGATVNVSATNVSTRTWPHTVGAGKNRILIVGIALADTSDSVSSVTYAGTALTRITSIQAGNSVEMWSLLAPPVGTANLVATWTANRDMVGWSGSFTNVDQTNPIRNSAVANDNSTTPNITVASLAGDLVVDTLSANGDAGSLTAGAGQTEIFQNTTGTSGGDCRGASSHEPGAPSVTMSWLAGSAKNWGIAAVALQAAPALQADIATTLNGPSSVTSGSNLTYTITVTNAGSITASNIVVTDLLPPGTSFFSATDGGASNNGAVTWPAFSLGANASTNFTLIVTARGSGTLTNRVSSAASTYDPDTSNNNGSAAAARVLTLVNLPPTITAQPVSQAVATGQNVSFSVTAGGTSPFSYQWNLNGAPLPGATSVTLVLTNVQMTNAGNYTVVVTNLAGSVTSTVATLSVFNGVVFNTNDSGAGSLRQAILNLNNSPGPGSIVFSLTETGPFLFRPNSPYPALTNAMTIDGTTVTNYSGVPLVTIIGTNAGIGASGLQLMGGNSTVRGLMIYGFQDAGIVLGSGSSNVIEGNLIGLNAEGSTNVGNAVGVRILEPAANNRIGGDTAAARNTISGNTLYGVQILGPGATNNLVRGNYIGTDRNGSFSVENGSAGILVSNAGWNVIGGTSPGAGNLISGNGDMGVYLFGPATRFSVVQGNLIGTDSTGTAALENGNRGVVIQDAPNTAIGGAVARAGNLIAGFKLQGIYLNGSSSTNVVIQGNKIGTDITGTLSLYTKGSAIDVYAGTNNLIGGLLPGAGNLLAFNKYAGINIWSGYCTILGNSIHDNYDYGIDLLGNGVTPNDAGDVDSGPNTLQNYPALSGATNNYGATRIVGTLSSRPGTTFRVELFASSYSVGDGGTFLGAVTLTTDGTGAARLDTVVTSGDITGQFVTATATDPSGNTSEFSASVPVTFNGSPLITSQPQSLTAVSGSSASLSVSASGSPVPTYQWFFQGGILANATNASLIFNPLTPSNAGNYAVVVANTSGSVTSAVATVTVLVPPTITTQPATQSAGQGQNASFSVAVSGTAPFSYQWSFNGTPLPGGTSATLALVNVQTNDAGSYTVVVANTAGSATSAVATLTVLVPPTITTQPQSLTVVMGENAAFSVGASGTAPLGYQWRRNGATLSGATNGILTLSNVRNPDAGNYTVVVSNPAGSVTSAVASLTVLLPPTIATQPFGQSATVGQNVAFTVTVSGTSPFAYQWSRNGTPLPGATGSTLALNNVQTSDAANYTVVITNVAGTVTSAVAGLAVTDPLVATPPFFGAGVMTPTGFTFRVCMPVGYTYLILASTNTRDWTQIYSNVAPSTNFLFVDSAATNQSLRFYQAQVLPPAAASILEQTAAGGSTKRVRAGEKGAQSFRHGSPGDPSYTINKVVLHLSRETLLPNTNLNISIGTGKNAGSLPGSSVAISPAGLTDTTSGTTFQTYEIVFSSPVGPLTAGTTYYLNLECEAGNGGRIYVESASDSAYANGTYYLNGSSDGEDAWFQLWGQ